MRMGLLTKMLLFAVVIATLPLIVSGQSLIRIARDELKSTANEQLITTAQQITDEFNDFYEFSLFSALNLIRNSIDGDKLRFDEKLTMLRQGISDLPDVVSLQVFVQGAPVPIVVTQKSFLERLSEKFDDPLALLRVEPEVDLAGEENERRASAISYIEEIDSWLAAARLPLKTGISGRAATLYAQIDLSKLRDVVQKHPFAQTGKIHIIDEDMNVLFSTGNGDIKNKAMVKDAIAMLESGSRAISVKPFTLEDGKISLGAISFTRPFPWAVLVEKSEEDAYLPVTEMISSLVLWLSLGLGAATIGAILFSFGLSRPILAISNAAVQIAKGNLDVRVENVKSRDEIGDLAKRFNEMIVQLTERLELQKFVSIGTMDAIQKSKDRSVSLGGERREVAILFADIRGYTAFSEDREPEEVVEVLNHYFQEIGELIAKHNGDIDKFVGDQVMAVFHGENKAKDSVKCAIAIMQSMEDSKASLPDAGLEIGIGVDMGEVVIGAMGSADRMDFTVLGDHVNLAARLCSKAAPRQTLVSKVVYKSLGKKLAKKGVSLPAITVKGKANPIPIYGFDFDI
ncbi:MAG: HAMP domain-containing protein [Rhizobiaceae bacterium]|nr:HAMP domain-containing protein [Rhizobiaceae bacterium]